MSPPRSWKNGGEDMKHVLTIQDLSCVGRCSATVALPVLSAMGVQCSLLPTAVLSTHSAYPGFLCRDLTQDLGPMADHWASLGLGFDGLYTGYLASPDQVQVVGHILDRFRQRAQVILVDPAMADHGRLYKGLPEDFPKAMADLCRRADVILPNLTEAALLTGRPYHPDPDGRELEALLAGLLALGPKAVLITGVGNGPGTTGFWGGDREGRRFSYGLTPDPQSRHGTGDLFAAVVMGSLVRGDGLEQAGKKAADFVLRCLQASAGDPRDPRLGVDFEKALPTLFPQ